MERPTIRPDKRDPNEMETINYIEKDKASTIKKPKSKLTIDSQYK